MWCIGKAAAVSDCLEDQFRLNDPKDGLRNHHKRVRRGVKFRLNHPGDGLRNHYKQFKRRVQFFRSTRLCYCAESVTSNEVRKIIKTPKHAKAPGNNGVTNGMNKQLPSHCVNNLVALYNRTLSSYLEKIQNFPKT